MLSLSFTVSLIFAFGALFFPEVLIGLYSEDPAVIKAGGAYLRFVGISYPIFAVSFAFQMSFRATEHVKLPMVCTGVSLIVNTVLNLMLIFGININTGFVHVSIPAMGVVGAAVATVISRIVEILLTLGYSYRHGYEACGPFRELFDFQLPGIAKFLRIAFPVIVNESLWGLGTTAENSIFAHAGTDAIAAFNITGTISQLTWVFFIGVGNAAGIIIGKRIGGGLEKEARQYANRFAWFMPVVAVGIGSLLYPLSLLLPILFKVDVAILKQSQFMLYVLIASYPVNAFNMCIIVGICRSGGDTIFAAFADIFWMWLVAIPLGAVAAFVWHLPPWQIYLCLQAEQLPKALTGFIRLKSGKWLRNVSF